MKQKRETHDANNPSNREQQIHPMHVREHHTSINSSTQHARFLQSVVKKYQDMMQCTDAQPQAEPTFNQILEGHQLSEAAKHYLRYQTLSYRDFK